MKVRVAYRMDLGLGKLGELIRDKRKKKKTRPGTLLDEIGCD